MSLASKIAVLIGISCLGLLATALYMEYQSGLVPCALCLAQRAAFVVIGVAAVLYLLPSYRAKLAFACLAMLGASLGIWLAGRQVWLQSLPPDQVPACGPDIYFMLDRFPFADTFQTLMMGSGNCAEVQWTLLGLSIPGWTLLWFIAMWIGSLIMLMRRGPRPFRLFNG